MPPLFEDSFPISPARPTARLAPAALLLFQRWLRQLPQEGGFRLCLSSYRHGVSVLRLPA
jgi:hypothetical protein